MGKKKNKKKNKNKKRELNYSFLILSCILILLGFFLLTNKNEISKSDLNQVDLTLKTPIKHVKSSQRRSNEIYAFLSNEYKSKFVIYNGTSNPSTYSKIEKLEIGDLITVSIDNFRNKDLIDISEQIQIYSLKRDDIILFDVESYIKNNSKYSWKSGIASILIGLFIGVIAFKL